jgi:hypothetical protein
LSQQGARGTQCDLPKCRCQRCTFFLTFAAAAGGSRIPGSGTAAGAAGVEGNASATLRFLVPGRAPCPPRPADAAGLLWQLGCDARPLRRSAAVSRPWQTAHFYGQAAQSRTVDHDRSKHPAWKDGPVPTRIQSPLRSRALLTFWRMAGGMHEVPRCSWEAPRLQQQQQQQHGEERERLLGHAPPLHSPPERARGTPRQRCRRMPPLLLPL